MAGGSTSKDNTAIDVYRRYADMVYRLALLMVKNKMDADDIFQEVFIKFSKAHDSLKSEEHIKAWLVRVTINQCKNFFRLYWNRNHVSIHGMEIPVEDPVKREIIGYVIKLPEKYKVVIYLYYYLGYSTEEIAAIVNTRSATIRTRLKRAREMLKNHLAHGGFDYE